MRTLILSIVGPVTLYFVDKKRPFYVYVLMFAITVFIGLCGNLFCCPDLLPASERNSEVEMDLLCLYAHIEDEEIPCHQAALTPREQQMYWNAWQSCCDAGYQAVDRARKTSLFIPNIDKRTKVTTAITIAVHSMFGSGLKSKIMIALADTIAVYLTGMWDSWEKIRPDLEEANKRFKDADYFWKVLHPESK